MPYVAPRVPIPTPIRAGPALAALVRAIAEGAGCPDEVGDLVLRAYNRRSAELAAAEAVRLLRHPDDARFWKDAAAVDDLAAIVGAADADDEARALLAAADPEFRNALAENPPGAEPAYRKMDRPRSIAVTALMNLYH